MARRREHAEEQILTVLRHAEDETTVVAVADTYLPRGHSLTHCEHEETIP